jgi:type IV secretion system protein VirB10
MTDVDVDARPGTAPQADRAISPIAGRPGSGRAGRAVVLAALVAGCAVFGLATWRAPKSRAAATADQPAQQIVPFEPLKAPANRPTLATPGPGAPSLIGGTGGEPVPAIQAGGSSAGPASPSDPRGASLAAIRGAPLIAYSGQGGIAAPIRPAGSDAAPAIAAFAGAAPSELDQLRHGSSLGLARASRLPDRNFLIVAGAALPCLLQTAMDTATPGYVSCLIPRDVLSDNGAVVLMEKGTRVLGEYRSSLKQGQARLFVLWTRAVTPAGVAIRLESPAADALGRAGFDGDLDTHFWDRFGGALLLSIVDDGTYALAGGNGGQTTARVPSDAAAVALQNSVAIPPSLRKAQGSEVSIFVAQDFDFSGVYGLKAR